MSDMHDTALDWIDDQLPPSRIERIAAHVRAWAAPLAVVSAVGAAVLAISAAHLLANADLGTRLRARSCDASPVLGLVVFVLAGACIALTPRLLQLRTLTTVLTIRLTAAAAGGIVPLVLLIATLPGTLGCATARTIARWQLFGDALTGTAGVALCAACALTLGIAIVSMLQVTVITNTDTSGDIPTIVELAIQEAAELERSTDLNRFRGVD